MKGQSKPGSATPYFIPASGRLGAGLGHCRVGGLTCMKGNFSSRSMMMGKITRYREKRSGPPCKTACKTAPARPSFPEDMKAASCAGAHWAHSRNLAQDPIHHSGSTVHTPPAGLVAQQGFSNHEGMSGCGVRARGCERSPCGAQLLWELLMFPMGCGLE